MVSLSVIAILIGLLLPTMASVRQTAYKIICRSNVRQIGLGIRMYSDDYADALPSTIFVGSASDPGLRQIHKTTTLRIGEDPAAYAGMWDGLGRLYVLDYLRTPQVFYCPAENGPTGWSNQVRNWTTAGAQVIGNYQYRGEGPNKERYLTQIRPSTAALVTNALSSKGAYSHGDGCNVLRADMSVYWFADLNGELLQKLADDPFQGGDVGGAWDLIDERQTGGSN